MMNNENAIEILEQRKKQNKKYYLLSDSFKKENEALDIAIESLLNAEINNKIIKTQHDRIQELKDNEWVDVRDRLPSDEEEYLICDNDQLMYVSSYEKFKDGTRKWVDDYGEELTDGIRPIKVIAWKPLPHPYERKE